MYQFTSLTQKDEMEILEFWSNNFGAEFSVDMEKLNRNIFEAFDFFKNGSFCLREKESGKLIGCIAVKLSDNQELYPDTAWITLLFINPAYRGKGYGEALYKKSEEALKKEDVKRIYIGQDFLNFFSGIPSPDKRKDKFFEKCGFILNQDLHYDLEADVFQNKKMDDFKAEAFDTEFLTQPLKKGEEKKLLNFLEEVFPGRWKYEAEHYLAAGGDYDKIVLLKQRENDAIKGYCMLDVQQDHTGGLGPIGIVADVRGRHVGDYILRQSLLQLRRLKAEKICIDWTILKDFYGQFGFEPVRIFRGGYKDINK